MKFRAYALTIAGFVTVSLPVAYAWRNFYGSAVIRSAGDLASPEVVARMQSVGGALYGSAIYPDDFEYKLALIRANRPDIVALGSSRAMQFRKEFFSGSFINAGGAMRSIDQGARFIELMAASHRPKLVILAVDIWWLNANRPEPPAQAKPSDRSRGLGIFWGFMNDRKVSSIRTLRLLLGDHSNPVSSRPGIGIAAVVRGTGFRPDGSRDYGARYFGMDPAFADGKFVDWINRAVQGRPLLEHGHEIDIAKFKKLQDIIKKLTSEGADVVAVLPPLASPVMAKIDGNQNFSYVPRAIEALKTLPIPVFDFSHAETIGSGNCEFADGLHPGDVAYQRMLLAIARSEEGIRRLINLDFLTATVEAFAGHAVTPMSADGYYAKEVDFLDIGCRK
jgi:hypothetical protein